MRERQDPFSTNLRRPAEGAFPSENDISGGFLRPKHTADFRQNFVQQKSSPIYPRKN
jgi:hypothetical protein